MKQTYITRSRKRDWIEIGLLAILLGLATGTFAQEASLGNTTVFGGAQMTLFGNHNFVTGGAGTQVGIIGTERTSAAGYGKVNYAANSLVVTGANDANHVDGYVGKSGAGLFVYPVGDNGFYGPFAATGDGTTGAYFHADPNSAVTSNLAGGNYIALPSGAPFATTSKAADVTTVSTVEYWDIDGAAVSKITLTWDAGSAVGTLTGSDLTKLGIVGWDGSKWVKTASTVDVTSVLTGASLLAAGSITTNASIIPNAYTAYTLASVVNAVPDLTPAQFFSNTQLNAGETVDYVVAISNVGTTATTAAFIFRVTNFIATSGLTLTLNPAASVTIDGDVFPLSNADFDVAATATRFSFTSKTGVVLPMLGVKYIGFKISRTGGTVGSLNNTVTIDNGTGGGETPINNNTIANLISKF